MADNYVLWQNVWHESLSKGVIKKSCRWQPFSDRGHPNPNKANFIWLQGNVFLSDMQMFDCINVFVLEELTFEIKSGQWTGMKIKG